jgi:hypothetical protein
MRALGAILLAACLAGCVTRQAAPPAPAPAPSGRRVPSPRLGRPFDVVAARSQLIVLVYRTGPLAALGHDHVISCRCLAGRVYLPRDPLRASFDVRIPVERLTVDDSALRAAQHSADFPPDVPASDREGTRRHMLGAAQLSAALHPDITLRSEGLRASPDGRPGDLIVQVAVRVAGQSHSITVPMHYDIREGEIMVTGAFPLALTDLGITPYSIMGGALRVRNGMRVRMRLVARRSGP